MEAEDVVTINMGDFHNHKISELFSMLDFAVRCKVHNVLCACLQLLKRKLSCENVTQIFQKVHLCKLEAKMMEDGGTLVSPLKDMKNFCFQFMLRNGDELLKSSGFLSMSRQNVVKLVRSDHLNCSELDVFLAAVLWAKAHVRSETNNRPIEPLKLRAAMNKIFTQIRFSLLSVQDIVHHVVPYKILTPDERVKLFRYINSHDDLKPGSPFICRPRVLRRREIRRESELDVESRGNNVRADFVASSYIIYVRSMNISVNNLEQSFPTISNLNTIRLQPDSQTPGPSRLTRPSTSSILKNYIPSGSNCVSTLTPSVPPSPSLDLSTSTNRTKKTKFTSLKRKRVIYEGKTLDSDDMTPVQKKKSCEVIPWADYVRRFATAKDLHTIRKIKLENVKTMFNFKKSNAIELIPTKLYMPSLQEAYFDVTDDQFEKNFSDFVRLFDVRKFIFFTKTSSSNNWKLEDIWNMGIRITIIVNGVKILEVNKPNNELTISFRNYSDEIMSGLNKTDKLVKLNLIKTDVPNSDTFPAQHLKRVLLYYVWAYNKGTYVGQFVRACVNLEEFSCYALASEGLPKRKTDLIILDLDNDFVSGNSLKRIAIYHCRLVTSKISSKGGVKELYLDSCFWPKNFVDKIHHIFPSLQRIALRRQDNQPLKSSKVTLTMLSNLLQIPSLEWVRIWGMNWEDTPNKVSSTCETKLRSRGQPIQKIRDCQTVMKHCGLIGATNFILEKNNGSWKATVLNDKESQELDGGFWDFMDQLDYKYYQLENVYKDCETYQNNFECHWNE